MPSILGIVIVPTQVAQFIYKCTHRDRDLVNVGVEKEAVSVILETVGK